MTRNATLTYRAVPLLLLLASGPGRALAAATAAPWTPEPATLTVHFEDLNLDHAAGVAMLYRRISAAATRVCGEPQPTGSRIIAPSWRRCVTQAIEQAVATLDRPALTSYYHLHSRPSQPVTAVARR
jgi:UrcA family protein